nr:hypothetical protein HK105_003198 [Polyrhizophydium stewartii]
MAARTFAAVFNLACRAVGVGALADAERLLKKAQKMCRESMAEDGHSEADVERELAVIVAQLAYVYQLQGRTALAADQYNAVLKSKGIDGAILAVASNNLMSIRGERHELFESAKNHRFAASAEVLQKLNSAQRKVVEINGALLSLYLKRSNAADEIAALETKYPDNERLLLARAGIAFRQKKSTAALREEIEAQAAAHPNSISIQLALVQIHLNDAAWQPSIELVEALLAKPVFERYRPGLISILTWLHGKTGNTQAALEVLETATKSSSTKGKDLSLLAQLAAFKLNLQRYKEAAQDYLQLVRADPLDQRAVANLVIALSHHDHATAASADGAQEAQDMQVDLDTDALEAAVLKRREKQQLHLAAASGAAADAGESGADGAKNKVAKKRKRNKPKPKNYNEDATPDPERWIPKKFRTAFLRKSKNRRDMLSKGPQGINMEGGGIGGTGSARIAGLSKSQAAAVAAAAPEPAAEPEPAPAPPKPAAPAAAQGGKKGKKGRR